jgi:Kef-type K+ transport system membrane component KefB
MIQAMETISPFMQMAAVLALAAGLATLGLLLRQPLIVAFIAAGIIAGPHVLGIVESAEQVALPAQIGIALLLFLVGLKLDLQIVRSLGGVALATGLGQIAFTAITGYFICAALGLDAVTGAYVAVALTFSSTIIIVKLLTDKREADSLHGRIAIGLLIVQDVVVVLAMIVLSALGVRSHAHGALNLEVMLGGAAILLLLVSVFIRHAAEQLVRWVARTPELLVTFALAWAVAFAAASDFIGLGKELGGLLAGVALASTSYREAIAARLTSLRDFLLLFFFIALGAGMRTDTIGGQLPAALALSAFVLIGKPLIMMAIMGWMGYRKRTGLLAGVTVAQISEFSLIFMAMGISLGHVAPESMSLVTLVGLITITLSTYLILNSHAVYRVLETWLGWLERRRPHRENETAPEPGITYDVILFGLGRYGREIARVLEAGKNRVFGVDFDPEALRAWRSAGRVGVYGDAADPEFPASLPLAGAGWAIIATPPPTRGLVHEDARLIVMTALRAAGFQGRFAVRSHGDKDAAMLLGHGASVVLSPYVDAAQRAAEFIRAGAAGSASPSR